MFRILFAVFVLIGLSACASAAQVRRAISATPGSRGNVIRLTQWQSFGGS